MVSFLFTTKSAFLADGPLQAGVPGRHIVPVSTAIALTPFFAPQALFVAAAAADMPTLAGCAGTFWAIRVV